MHVLLFYNCVLTVVKYTDMLCYVAMKVPESLSVPLLTVNLQL